MLDDLDSLIREAMTEWQIPGLAIAVVQHDAPIFLKGFGERDSATWKLACP
jgi:CubicO group peptidase (beta-lactamase class C family)